MKKVNFGHIRQQVRRDASCWTAMGGTVINAIIPFGQFEQLMWRDQSHILEGPINDFFHWDGEYDWVMMLVARGSGGG